MLFGDTSPLRCGGYLGRSKLEGVFVYVPYLENLKGLD